MPYSTLLFDLDGTLVDTAPDLLAALNHVLTDLHGLAAVDDPALRGIVGLGARAMLEHGFKTHGIDLPEADMVEAHKAFLDYYRHHICEHSRPYESVAQVLGHMRADGKTLAVCTNKTESLSVTLLDQLGLLDLFEIVCGSDTVRHRKPHPDHILTALSRAGGRTDEALMVGDSAADIDAAKAAGIPVIAMSYGYSVKPIGELGADRILDDFAALPQAIASL